MDEKELCFNIPFCFSYEEIVAATVQVLASLWDVQRGQPTRRVTKPDVLAFVRHGAKLKGEEFSATYLKWSEATRSQHFGPAKVFVDGAFPGLKEDAKK